MDTGPRRPKPSYPSNYYRSNVPSSPTPPPRKTSSNLNLPGLSGKREKSFLSLASLNLAHSTSSLLGIFSSASSFDSIPPTPSSTPPLYLEGKVLNQQEEERFVFDQVRKWRFTRDVIRCVSILFVMGYAFALYVSLPANIVFCVIAN
jgi:hypothetical protein